MAETIETISYVKIGNGEVHPIDAVTLGGNSPEYFQASNLVTSIDKNSTDSQYPSAKCMWDIYGAIEETLKAI